MTDAILTQQERSGKGTNLQNVNVQIAANFHIKQVRILHSERHSFHYMPELKELSKMLRIKFITVENFSRPALGQLGWREINLVSCPTSMTIWEGESGRRSLVERS